MCPRCEAEGRTCAVRERPDGTLGCECGRHAWPSSGVYLEDCRLRSLTTTGRVHTWTQSY